MWNYSWYFSPSVLYRFIISPHPPAGPSSVCCNACGGRQSPPAWSHPPSQHPPPPLFFLLSVCTCWSVLAQLSWDLFTCKMRSQCSPAECPSWLCPPRRPRAADPPTLQIHLTHTHVPTHSSSHLNGLWAPDNVSYPGCSSQSWRNRKLFTAPEKNAHASRRCRLITLLEGKARLMSTRWLKAGALIRKRQNNLWLELIFILSDYTMPVSC